MSGFSDYAENKVSDAVRRGQPLGAPATMYYGLFGASKGTRANSTAYALNDTIVALIGGKYFFYKCTTAGTTAAAQPGTYLGAVAEAITDGSAVFTEQTAAISAGTFTELTGTGYARVAVAASLANFSGTQGAGTTVASSGSGGTQTNNGAITWPSPTGAWTTGSMAAVGVFWSDSATGGNMWEWGMMAAPKSINASDPAPAVSPGTLSWQIGG